jgi:hypothetical protein
VQQVFAHNRNEISAFAAELVFCEVPGEFLQWGWDGEGVGVGIGGGVALILFSAVERSLATATAAK